MSKFLKINFGGIKTKNIKKLNIIFGVSFLILLSMFQTPMMYLSLSDGGGGNPPPSNPNVSIDGYVYDTAGNNGVGGVTVYITDSSGISYSTTTTSYGFYAVTIQGTNSGTIVYTVSVSRPGWWQMSSSPTIYVGSQDLQVPTIKMSPYEQVCGSVIIKNVGTGIQGATIALSSNYFSRTDQYITDGSGHYCTYVAGTTSGYIDYSATATISGYTENSVSFSVHTSSVTIPTIEMDGFHISGNIYNIDTGTTSNSNYFLVSVLGYVNNKWVTLESVSTRDSYDITVAANQGSSSSYEIQITVPNGYTIAQDYSSVYSQKNSPGSYTQNFEVNNHVHVSGQILDDMNSTTTTASIQIFKYTSSGQILIGTAFTNSTGYYNISVPGYQNDAGMGSYYLIQATNSSYYNSNVFNTKLVSENPGYYGADFFLHPPLSFKNYNSSILKYPNDTLSYYVSQPYAISTGIDNFFSAASTAITGPPTSDTNFEFGTYYSSSEIKNLQLRFYAANDVGVLGQTSCNIGDQCSYRDYIQNVTIFTTFYNSQAGIQSGCSALTGSGGCSPDYFLTTFNSQNGQIEPLADRDFDKDIITAGIEIAGVATGQEIPAILLGAGINYFLGASKSNQMTVSYTTSFSYYGNMLEGFGYNFDLSSMYNYNSFNPQPFGVKIDLKPGIFANNKTTTITTYYQIGLHRYIYDLTTGQFQSDIYHFTFEYHQSFQLTHICGSACT